MAERWGIGLMAAIGAAAGGLSAAAASLLDGGDALPAGLAVGVAGGAVVSAALAWAVRQRDLPGLSTPSPSRCGVAPARPGARGQARRPTSSRWSGDRRAVLGAGRPAGWSDQRLGDTRPDLRGSAPLAEADRLARRSARAATTLLVLADPDELAPPGRDRTIAEVLDAALADSAHRDRIDVGSLHDETVRGLFVGDVAHLLAELIDNAAAASVEPVVVVGQAPPPMATCSRWWTGRRAQRGRPGRGRRGAAQPAGAAQPGAPVTRAGALRRGQAAWRHAAGSACSCWRRHRRHHRQGCACRLRICWRAASSSSSRKRSIGRWRRWLRGPVVAAPEGDHVDDPTSPMSLFDGAHDDTAVW
ncbi:MAG: hypothetical protein R2749_05220 [Acidimicrobiales bacterium]